MFGEQMYDQEQLNYIFFSIRAAKFNLSRNHGFFSNLETRYDVDS
jgi:hypothetical protein